MYALLAELAALLIFRSRSPLLSPSSVQQSGSHWRLGVADRKIRSRTLSPN